MGKFFWSEPQSDTAFPIAKPGYPLIFAAAFITFVFALLNFEYLSIAGIIVTIFICCFFRDPDRVTPDTENAVVSPADGKIVFADVLKDSPYYKEPSIKVSVFMSVFNVHVNRIPYDGRVTAVEYNPGKFFSANLDKASRDNEQNAIFLETEKKQKICFVQIAGLIARRIICKAQTEDIVSRGQRFGMICFGSRLDVYLPADAKLNVSVGDRVKAGSSILGYLA